MAVLGCNKNISIIEALAMCIGKTVDGKNTFRIHKETAAQNTNAFKCGGAGVTEEQLQIELLNCFYEDIHGDVALRVSEV